MPNFNPMERQSLLNLLTALRGGLDPSVGSSFLGDVLGQQQGRVDERQAKMQSITDMLVGGAAEGRPLESAETLSDVYYPGGAPPRVEGAISTLYPMETQTVATPQRYAGGNTPSEVGAYEPTQDITSVLTEIERQSQYSPTYQPTPEDQLNEMRSQVEAAELQQQYEAATTPQRTVGDLIGAIHGMQQDGLSVQEIRREVYADPEAASLVSENIRSLQELFPGVFVKRPY